MTRLVQLCSAAFQMVKSELSGEPARPCRDQVDLPLGPGDHESMLLHAAMQHLALSGKRCMSAG